ncbi:SAM-dependent methyltransferase [candidate division TA06 bacterium B3_TA06]|uniref:SAM-dependent methyltransferase n=1 Tax=candidate division TA06 bacterium B3_TA06 TaxID=2012487 RepID=A0A532V6X8_UNCT6|nr:MAG: SAM-dependent methyltransferase [candidate division TA06 bacterium B3_TA06]
MDEYINANRRHWNELVEIHAKSKFYDVEGFKAGRLTLDRIEQEGVGDVKGKSLLHLQCHFGMDTLSFARLGAEVTGIDFSTKAIRLARDLSSELGLNASFVCSEIYDLPKKLSGEFDIVFTSYGVLPWLPDLKRWAEVITHFLKPGGIFYIVESHPFAHVFNDGNVSDLQVHYPYFAKAPMRFDEHGSYADAEGTLEHTVHYEWMHPMSEIISSLIAAGLTIQSLKEYPFTPYKMLPFMKQDQEGWWRLPDGREDVPLLFSLKATKKECSF